MKYTEKGVEGLNIAYIGGGSRGWAWGLMSDLVSADDISGENIKNVFDVVFEDDEKRHRYFSGWYTDASHKIRHGLIHGKCIQEDGKIISVALTSGETDKIAVISSVATLKNHRKKGYGEKVVLALAQSIGKDIYLLTDNETTAQWYEKMGFDIVIRNA